MNATLSAAAFVALAATAVRAQGVWQLCGSAARVSLRGAAAAALHGPRDSKGGLAAGDYRVAFGADALGKPMSLAFPVPPGAEVHVAVDGAGAAGGRTLVVGGDGWNESAGKETVLVTGKLDEVDYRLEVRCDDVGVDAVVGLVARWTDAASFYAFVFDRARGEVRMERHMGPDALVVARAALPTATTAAPLAPVLALQVEGFRLQGLVDDEVVLQLFDGALTHGAYGVCWRGAARKWGELRVTAPAAPRASAALVRDAARAATLHVATAVTPGHWYVLELRLDRPHPLVPMDAAGLEPWLLARPAAPLVLQADWRGGLGRGSIGEVPPDGRVSSPVEWPDLVALRLHVALARVVLVTPDGTLVTAASPAAPVRF